jgi:hypothetical protein
VLRATAEILSPAALEKAASKGKGGKKAGAVQLSSWQSTHSITGGGHHSGEQQLMQQEVGFFGSLSRRFESVVWSESRHSRPYCCIVLSLGRRVGLRLQDEISHLEKTIKRLSPKPQTLNSQDKISHLEKTIKRLREEEKDVHEFTREDEDSGKGHAESLAELEGDASNIGSELEVCIINRPAVCSDSGNPDVRIWYRFPQF